MLLSKLWKHRLRVALIGCAVLVLSSGVASAQWNDRTELTFSEPVMVPGATLPAGSYVFRLTDSRSNRHLVEIAKKNGEVITITQAVPMKRQDARGDLVLKFNPTEQGTPPAVAGWYYPGSIYGHHFVYPDAQAKVIAERTKTVVVSTDVPGTDLERGKLRVYDASGIAKDWQPDADVSASWEDWRKNRTATAGVVAETTTGERAKATAPAIDAAGQGMRVTLDDLESNPQQYIGKTVSVDAEVEEVFGPRVFKIDEHDWMDFEGELLVYVPTDLAALVREEDRVTVTGQVKRFVKADLENEWGWGDIDDTLEVKLGTRPVLVASHVVGGNNQSALVIDVRNRGAMNSSTTAKTAKKNTTGDPAQRNTPVGTSGGTMTADTTATNRTRSAMTDMSTVAAGDVDLVGRDVSLDNVRVESKAKDLGFFARAGNRVFFVLPTVGQREAVEAGRSISIEGVVLQMPRFMRDKLNPPEGRMFNDEIYVYATQVQR